jgi:hypothetical protein
MNEPAFPIVWGLKDPFKTQIRIEEDNDTRLA